MVAAEMVRDAEAGQAYRAEGRFCARFRVDAEAY